VLIKITVYVWTTLKALRQSLGKPNSFQNYTLPLRLYKYLHLMRCRFKLKNLKIFFKAKLRDLAYLDICFSNGAPCNARTKALLTSFNFILLDFIGKCCFVFSFIRMSNKQIRSDFHISSFLRFVPVLWIIEKHCNKIIELATNKYVGHTPATN